ncbi:MAG: hypothetical protein H6559_02935 [Lewinellaceae bacterium]|nr:hypothetical protein [Lewinellaceae bacterium]
MSKKSKFERMLTTTADSVGETLSGKLGKGACIYWLPILGQAKLAYDLASGVGEGLGKGAYKSVKILLQTDEDK